MIRNSSRHQPLSINDKPEIIIFPESDVLRVIKINAVFGQIHPQQLHRRRTVADQVGRVQIFIITAHIQHRSRLARKTDEKHFAVYIYKRPDLIVDKPRIALNIFGTRELFHFGKVICNNERKTTVFIHARGHVTAGHNKAAHQFSRHAARRRITTDLIFRPALLTVNTLLQFARRIVRTNINTMPALNAFRRIDHRLKAIELILNPYCIPAAHVDTGLTACTYFAVTNHFHHFALLFSNPSESFAKTDLIGPCLITTSKTKSMICAQIHQIDSG